MRSLEALLAEPHAPADRPLTLTFSAETRAVLDELFRRLGETLKPNAPSGLQQQAAFLAQHLGVPAIAQRTVARVYPRPASNQTLVALADVLGAAPYRVETVTDYDDEGQRAPRYRPVPVTPTVSRDVLAEGYYAGERDGTPFVVGVKQQRSLHVWVQVRADDQPLADALLVAIDEQPKIYRGQAVTLNARGFPTFLAVPPTRFPDDVVLNPETQAEVERHVLRFATREAAYRAAGLSFRRGVLLAGPPGVGKTHVFRALTHALAGAWTVLWLTPRSIQQEQDVAGVFAFARSLAPTLLLWEDIDLVVRDRSDARTAGVLGELLAQLDGAESAEGIITCASTNDTSVLDAALSARPSRFDVVLHIGAPAREARLRMLRQFSAHIERLDADLALIADRTQGFTGAYLQELVVAAFTDALDASDDSDGPVAVRTEHFLEALSRLNSRGRALNRWEQVWGTASR